MFFFPQKETLLFTQLHPTQASKWGLSPSVKQCRLTKGPWGRSTHKAQVLLAFKARRGMCHSHRPARPQAVGAQPGSCTEPTAQQHHSTHPSHPALPAPSSVHIPSSTGMCNPTHPSVHPKRNAGMSRSTKLVRGREVTHCSATHQALWCGPGFLMSLGSLRAWMQRGTAQVVAWGGQGL